MKGKEKTNDNRKRFRFIFTLYLLPFTLFFTLHPSPFFGDYVKTINAHLYIKDFASAQEEAVDALYLFPHSKPLWRAYIKVLARQGNEKEMITAWHDYVQVFPEEKLNQELTEVLAWGIINHASHSSSPVIRVMALLSAFLSQDAKGIEIIRQSLRDTNSAIREIAVQLSADLRDDVIKDEIYRIFKEETVWSVRLEAIRTLGEMKIKMSQGELLALLQNTKTTAEEMAAAVMALVNMWDFVTRDEIGKLARSNRAGLRLLACQMVAHFDMKEDIDLIAPLIDDHHADVRKTALWVMGYLRINQVNGSPLLKLVEKKINDRDPLVSLKAIWVITLNYPEKGQKAFKQWFKHTNRDIRIMAAAHLAACGKYGFPLVLEQFKSSKEPLIRMNLALGLIGQRAETQLACQALYEGLQNVQEKWTWDEKNQVHALVPSKLRRRDDLNNSPETIDQITRLEILNILAMMKFPQAQQAIKCFLQEKAWGITAMAAATLLTEGDETALELVQNLLNEPEMKVRIQAALILALWGGSDQVLDILSEAYQQVNREMKEHILEGIVRVASPKSIPFLLDRVLEPTQSLRVIAAAGLILCLYH